MRGSILVVLSILLLPLTASAQLLGSAGVKIGGLSANVAGDGASFDAMWGPVLGVYGQAGGVIPIKGLFELTYAQRGFDDPDGDGRTAAHIIETAVLAQFTVIPLVGISLVAGPRTNILLDAGDIEGPSVEYKKSVAGAIIGLSFDPPLPKIPRIDLRYNFDLQNAIEAPGMKLKHRTVELTVAFSLFSL